MPCSTRRNIWSRRSHEAPDWIVPCLEGENPTRTSGSSIYPAVQNMLLAARALGLGPTSDDAVLAVREGSGGRARVAAERPLVRPAADRLSHGPFLGQSAVFGSLMSSMKTDGVSLIGMPSGSKCPVSSVERLLDGRSRPSALQTPPTCSSLSNESINVRCVYRIETGQSFFDLRVRLTKNNCVRSLSNLP